MASNQGNNLPPGRARTTAMNAPRADETRIPATPRESAMRRLRAFQDPETAAVNEHYRQTGQLPQIKGSTPMPGATPDGIAGTRFTPVNRPRGGAAGAQAEEGNLPPGIAINRARAGGRAPVAIPQPRAPKQTWRVNRNGVFAPNFSDLPPGIALRQPGPGQRRDLRRYGAFIPSSPSTPSMPSQMPPPALRPAVPPPSHFDLAERTNMARRGQGWLKIPIIYMGTLPDLVYDEFDARTGYNPPPEWEGPEDEKWKTVLEGSLRGVRFSEWNTSWLMRMAQLKEVDMSVMEGGDADQRHDLESMLNNVQTTEASIAKQAAEDGEDGKRWARFEGTEVETQTHVWVHEDMVLDVIKIEVATSLRRRNIEAEEVSLWISSVTWGNKPARMMRFAGRNSEIDDGYWLGFYVYRLSPGGAELEKQMSERYERETRAVAA
ncbi:hypothetical protein V493_08534 [Pseudogymnoascus sp. VKM F-4281 (FW-2241)]|nr:hypothetical protein V493_08534 [Pseudogymnoascus sp. VKM F-4281 (FW-2241)]